MSKPVVLVIDDQADDERGKLVGWEQSLELRIRHPQDVTDDDLLVSTVIVIDYRLDEPWAERDERTTISLQPMDGLALAGVLKSHDRSLDGRPTAFILRSAHLRDLSPEFPPDARLHIIAAQNNLEWVLDKTTDPDFQLRHVCRLSDAIAALPESWPTDNLEAMQEIICQWLAIPDLRWRDLAWQDIEECHPPIHELYERKHGLRLVRWLCHRILPYPCFLWTSERLAARLKVTHVSLKAGLKSGLADLFAPAQYNGALHSFDGATRWWSRGVETIFWDETSGHSFDTGRLIDTLNDRCGNKLEPLTISQPVLTIDENLEFNSEPCDVSEAVRVQPDD